MRELNKPFCQFHTQYNRDIPWDSIDMDFMNLNQTAHGDREFGFIGSRLQAGAEGYCRLLGRSRRPPSGLMSGCGPPPLLPTERRLKVARFGDNMREVAVTEGDKVEAQKVFGYSVHGYGLGDLAAMTAAVREAEIDALVAELQGISTSSGQALNPVSERNVYEQEPGWKSVSGASSRKWEPKRSPPASKTSTDWTSCPDLPVSASWPTVTVSGPRVTGKPPPLYVP